jgi:hypothetical protein
MSSIFLSGILRDYAPLLIWTHNVEMKCFSRTNLYYKASWGELQAVRLRAGHRVSESGLGLIGPGHPA